MTDKVQKIREEVARLQNELIQGREKGYGSDVDDACILELQNVLTYIDSMQEEPVSDIDFEQAAADYEEEKWKAGHPEDTYNSSDIIKAVKYGAKWQKGQFEKNRLEHCNSITNKQAELEQGFIDQHIDKYQRMPTFLDAIEYGMRLQKQQDQEHPDKESFAKRLKLEKEEWEDEYRQQMMKEAVEATVMHHYSQSKEGFNGRVIFCSDSLDYLKTGDKVNIKVFKED